MNAWNLGNPAIEDRLFGMDRRLFIPTLAVVGITFLLGKVLPFIDHQIPAGEYQAGAVQKVHDLIQFSPAPGWMPDGVPAPSAPSLTIFKDGVSFTVAPGAWDGSADELLDSILETSRAYQTEGERRHFELPGGMHGVALELFGISEDGAVFALVAPDTVGILPDERFIGVRIVVRGPADLLPELATEIGMMLNSFSPVDSSSEEDTP